MCAKTSSDEQCPHCLSWRDCWPALACPGGPVRTSSMQQLQEWVSNIFHELKYFAFFFNQPLRTEVCSSATLPSWPAT